MPNRLPLTLLVCAGLTAACGGAQPADPPRADIGRVVDLKATFGPPFTVTTIGPAAVDQRLLSPQQLPPGLVFAPAECAKSTAQQSLPPGIRGNMAATTAVGEGVRYIVIAVETSEPMPGAAPSEQCRKVSFTGAGMRGQVESIEVPDISGAETRGSHRVLQTTTAQGPRTGELYNYVSHFGDYTVIVTANPLVIPGRPVAQVDIRRARDLIAAAVDTVRG